MANPKNLISPKVAFATGGSVGGYTLGKALSTLVLYLVGKAATPPEVAQAVEFLIGAICVGGATFLSGYFKAEPKE